MATDSSQLGYLVPSSTPPSTDKDLDSLLQQIAAGLSGLPGNLVRPLWQAVEPKQLSAATNWIAIGVTSIRNDANPYIVHDPTGEGSDTLIRHESLNVLVSCYGPQGQQYALQIADGIYLNQNHSMLQSNNMGLIGVGQIRAIPELINKVYRHRFDFNITLRRKVTRTYSILTLESAEVDITTDNPVQTETVTVTNE